jgi:hypothetical protein
VIFFSASFLVISSGAFTALRSGYQAYEFTGLAAGVLELVRLVRGHEYYIAGLKRPIAVGTFNYAAALEYQAFMFMLMLMMGRAPPGVDFEVPHIKVAGSVFGPDEHSHPGSLGSCGIHRLLQMGFERSYFHLITLLRRISGIFILM